MADWDFSCPDWEERLRTGKTLVPDLPIDQVAADRAVSIYNRLHLPDVPGKPSMADASGDWQRDIVRAVFGSIDGQGIRKVQEVFALVPKKNSKTTSGAGMMLTALLVNKRPRAEYIFVGPTQEVADLAFQQASGMIDADPDGYLQKRFQVQEHIKTIKDRVTDARLKIKTFDLQVMTGAKPAGVLVDELHLMSNISYASRVIGQIRGGLVAYPEAFLIFITTQSDQAPAGVFKAELQYARGVRDGRIKDDARTLPVLYEFPERMQSGPQKAWQDPVNWPMVLPNLNRSIRLDRLVSDYRTATEKGDDEVRRWASQHLNVEIGLALHTDRWIGADYWTDAADESISLEAIISRCDVATIGIDGGGLDDLMAIAVVGRDRITRDWLTWCHAWAQPDVFKSRPQIAETLRDFEKGGDLTVCQHPTQDVREIADIVERLKDVSLLPAKSAIGFDPQGVAALIDEISSRKISDDQMVAVQQGYRLSNAIWGTERKLKDGTLWHGAQALMAWCVGNAKVEQRGNAILITKQAAGKAKIDPLMAIFDAVSLMSRNPEPVRQLQYQMIVVGR